MKTAIYWFKNNQRLNDNPSLFQAAQTHQLLPVYILPDDQDQNYRMGLNRYGVHRKQFLFESLRNLQADLQRAGGDLLILQGDPVEELKKLRAHTGIDALMVSKELDYLELKEQEKLKDHFEVLNGAYDQLLIQPSDLTFPPNTVPFGFSSFRKKVEKQMTIRQVLPIPDIKFLSTDFAGVQLDLPNPEKSDYSAHPFYGGVFHARERLKKYFWSTRKLRQYKATRNGLIGTDYSSKFSAFLALGNLSPVEIYWEVQRFEAEVEKNTSTYWLVFEILWREFFKYTSWKYGREFFLKPGILKEDRTYAGSDRQFQKWTDGRTGVPFVDANMKELNATGFMSNRGRQNVASFLVHDWKVDWRKGADYFERMLVDYDCSSNWGNWMYVAGVGNDRRTHKFDIEWQQQKYDARGKYVALWNG